MTESKPAPGAAEKDSAGGPLISVVVPTFNRAEWLGEALQTLARLRTDGRFRYEVVVVDNASSDNTRDVVQAIAADVPVRYVYESTPGDASARNRGLAEARGEWIAFFDDDQFAEPDWLLELYRAAGEAKSGVIGGAVHLHLTPEQSRQLGPICREALRELKPYEVLHPYDERMLPGCGNALVDRRVFDEIGRFDMSLVNGGSDTDFFLRAREAGHTPWHAPRAVILHRVPPNRLTKEYFRWDAWQGGDNIATHDFRRSSAPMMALRCAARAGQALLVHVPLLLAGYLRRDAGAVLGRKTRLWRAEAYLRKALALAAPRLFPQRRFFDALEFRAGRAI